jgi:hypothetical protein
MYLQSIKRRFFQAFDLMNTEQFSPLLNSATFVWFLAMRTQFEEF